MRRKDISEMPLEMKQGEFVVHEPSEQVAQPPACSPAGASHTEAVYRKSTALFVAIRLPPDRS